MRLLVGSYPNAPLARRSELLRCLQANAANRHISTVHVLVEEERAPAGLENAAAHSDGKVRLVGFGRRTTYRDLFAHAGAELPGQVVIVANADIFFDETLSAVWRYDLEDALLCLSRWDEQPRGPPVHYSRPDSQDAWIFRAPIREFPCDWHLGVPGCDNRLAFEAARAGLRVSNPSRSVRARHLHFAQVRNYTETHRLQGGYLHVPVLEETMPACSGASQRPLLALTSLSPSPARQHAQARAIRSWYEAGLRPVSFNGCREVDELRGRYDAEIVPVEETSAAVFGRPYVPIHRMLAFAAKASCPVLVINADIELRLQLWELQRLRWIADTGICYFVRHNYERDPRAALREVHGIDAFLFHGRDATLFPESCLSMGAPFWDYWLPLVFCGAGRPVYSVDFPAAFHRAHAQQWTEAAWRAAAAEFDRLTGAMGGAGAPFESWPVRQKIGRCAIAVPQTAEPIRDWVTQRFGGTARKIFLELGAHVGTDTAWMAALPGVVIHAFEPDPRNAPPPFPNVVVNRAAVADRDGTVRFYPSREGWGKEWTHSSSIRRPKRHLDRYPVSFGDPTEVEAVSLDSYAARSGIAAVDLIWASIQGAEGEMIRGAQRLLQTTRYLYTDFSDDEMYEGQPRLSDIVELLPEFRVLEVYRDHVLLENKRLAR